MKAVVMEKIGPPDVLQIKEVDKPNPKDNEVLVKVYASTVTQADRIMRSGDAPLTPLLKPIARKSMKKIIEKAGGILGNELAGVIDSVGKNVKKFKPGNEIFASTSVQNFGAYVEYRCIPEDGIIAIKPSNMSFGEAASVPMGGHTALFFLKKANIQNGQKVLIYGASGSVGTFAVQLAKYFGAEVTGVCSTSNLEMVKSLGADKVIDYTKEDFSKNRNYYDVIFDTVGKSSYSRFKKALKKKGILLEVGLKPSHLLRGKWASITVIGGVTAKNDVESMNFLKELIEAGKLKTVIDKTYPIEQIAEAHAYVDKGHKKGNVVIKIL